MPGSSAALATKRLPAYRERQVSFALTYAHEAESLRFPPLPLAQHKAVVDPSLMPPARAVTQAVLLQTPSSLSSLLYTTVAGVCPARAINKHSHPNRRIKTREARKALRRFTSPYNFFIWNYYQVQALHKSPICNALLYVTSFQIRYQIGI